MKIRNSSNGDAFNLVRCQDVTDCGTGSHKKFDAFHFDESEFQVTQHIYELFGRFWTKPSVRESKEAAEREPSSVTASETFTQGSLLVLIEYHAQRVRNEPCMIQVLVGNNKFDMCELRNTHAGDERDDALMELAQSIREHRQRSTYTSDTVA